MSPCRPSCKGRLFGEADSKRDAIWKHFGDARCSPPAGYIQALMARVGAHALLGNFESSELAAEFRAVIVNDSHRAA